MKPDKMRVLSLMLLVVSAMWFAGCESEAAKKPWEKVDAAIEYAEKNHIPADSALAKFGLLPFPYKEEQFSNEVKNR